ncbi:Anaphase-promoting complex subunit 7 [Camellia lanceoleosa]|uniref:Anaphase-promoting complex subunit 7 n=1 Tax=Camellia lanceoleosa TaxID=1840588 RepID=A0ACC0HFW2_9ERIC|nr:Anaphase-promoting complex subunit 7 [Camellia lanceoleosa]
MTRNSLPTSNRSSSPNSFNNLGINENEVKFKIASCHCSLNENRAALVEMEGIPNKARNLQMNLMMGKLYQNSRHTRSSIACYKECLRHCPYVIEAIVALAEPGVASKDIISIFPQASQEEKPPLLLESHGGPTDEAHGILNLNIQYWMSRGWSFVDVNYGGSTGYGREYRERLLGSWGIVNVNDCCSCAKYLVDDGKVDGERICITGCSAGGYTTLASLAFRETFKAGASLFGIADLNSLRAEMHKFESHYISNLVGSEEALFERSPINFVDKFSCPIILFQGLEDKVVQPEQARKIYMALKKKGLPVALVEYEGEPHGFRKADNMKFTLEQQMVFFALIVAADQLIECFVYSEEPTEPFYYLQLDPPTREVKLE